MNTPCPIEGVLDGMKLHRKRGKGSPPKNCLMCERKVKGRGLCATHYSRFYKTGDPTATKLAPTGARKLFLDELCMAGTHDDECVPFPFKRGNHGYGTFRLASKDTLAHRYVCHAVNGPPPTPTHQAAHSCGKGAMGCVSPRHLRWATPEENMGDRILHGTTGRKTYPLEFVNEVKLIAETSSLRAIGRMFGMRPERVSEILKDERTAI